MTEWDKDGGVPLDIFELENLEKLDLQYQNIRFIPADISKLGNLHSLNLNHCMYLESLPDTVGELPNLKSKRFVNFVFSFVFICSHCEILKDFRSVLKKSAVFFHCAKLNLTVSSSTALHLRGCPSLRTPPNEIVARGTDSVKAYLKRLSGGFTENWRTKLMLVGLGGAGKTR